MLGVKKESIVNTSNITVLMLLGICHPKDISRENIQVCKTSRLHIYNSRAFVKFLIFLDNLQWTKKVFRLIILNIIKKQLHES